MARSKPPVTPQATSKAAPKAPPPLANIELVMDAQTGNVLHQKNPDMQADAASLSKLGTAFMTLRAVRQGKMSLDDLITFSEAAAGMDNNNFPDLTAKTQMTVREALVATVTSSANGVARALGEHMAKKGVADYNGTRNPERAFAREMTKVLREEVGMSEKTSFINASGLNDGPADHKCNFSTAQDMAKLAQKLMKDFPEYGLLLGATSVQATVMSSGQKQAMNGSSTNRFASSFAEGSAAARKAGFHAAADGPQKTGTNEYSRGIGLLTTAENAQGVRLISVVMQSGKSTRYEANYRNLAASYDRIKVDPTLAAAYQKPENAPRYALRSPSTAFAALGKKGKQRDATVLARNEIAEGDRPNRKFNGRSRRAQSTTPVAYRAGQKPAVADKPAAAPVLAPAAHAEPAPAVQEAAGAPAQAAAPTHIDMSSLAAQVPAASPAHEPAAAPAVAVPDQANGRVVPASYTPE